MANQGMLPAFLGNGFGQLGVMIFFVLSGFLMGYLYLFKEFSSQGVAAFAFSRIGRVFPLYIAIVILSFLISTYIDPNFHYEINDGYSFALATLFLMAPQELWTIPVEVQFYTYFCFVWLFFWVFKSRNILLIMAVLSIVPSLVTYILLQKLYPVFSTYSLMFFIGIGFSFFYKNRIGFRDLSDTSKFVLGMLSVCLLVFSLPCLRLRFGLVFSDDFYLRTWGDPVNWMIVSLLFYSSLIDSPSLKFLNGRFFEYLGRISYGFYLLHYPIITFVGGLEIYQILKLPIAFFAVMVIASLSYRFFELPASNYVKSLSSSGQ
ncbi:hypothetical protein AZF00_01115 [Zhongshania aliphaticivorans]|uniref:Acyltransferase 3 domain-containing protein n=2 Tax=Zhongshania aliphaticivorans TaxID=1470434 RepID=A0A127M175_9GAMM|nr:hypothetical protein AZF00_01115 [Zhongshania aliphaticivorans]